VSWLAIDSFTASNASPVVVTDNNAPPGKAFYRLRLDQP
jgi:hypothetical protein